MTHIEEWMRDKYDASARTYRKDDELDITGDDHQKLAAKISSICESFGRPINALDIGCGTGRYFHALRNTEKLVGMDVSSEMLESARDPVRAEEVSAREIELICANFYNHRFPAGSFDFIYAIGVFGNGCPILPEVLRKFDQWLKPGGRLFFDVLDSEYLPALTRVRKWLRRAIYLALPPRAQRYWDHRAGWPPLFVTSKHCLQRSMRRAGFAQTEIERCLTRLPLGDSRKLQCLAVKT
jgi:ubiquinone/menaquinone biosynthesis C-methylase UbiE